MIYDSNMLYVAIVEDNPLAGKLLREYMEDSDVRVTALYPSGEEALQKIPTLPLPDAALVDVGLPGISGIEVTRRLKERYPSIDVVVQTIFEDTKTIVEAIKAGASGYILKASPKEDILKALYEVKRGESFLSGRVARKVLQEFQRPEKEVREGLKTRFDLTEREEEILNELIRGEAYKQIADRLDLSIHTVNNHIRKIYEKLHVNSRGEAVAKAVDSNE